MITEVEADPGWKEEVYGWSDMFQLYDAIEDLPDDPRWLSLNMLVRNILVNDLVAGRC